MSLRHLWEQNPHCHWCGTTTVLFEKEGGGAVPADAATRDHLYSRFDPMRAKDHTFVLSCYKCNHDRGRIDERRWLQKPAPQKPALASYGLVEKGRNTLCVAIGECIPDNLQK